MFIVSIVRTHQLHKFVLRVKPKQTGHENGNCSISFYLSLFIQEKYFWYLANAYVYKGKWKGNQLEKLEAAKAA